MSDNNFKNESKVNKGNNGANTARIIFGIFMVLVYIAVGLLFIFDIFSIDNTAISCTVGGLLIIYGFWRGYRLYRGWN